MEIYQLVFETAIEINPGAVAVGAALGIVVGVPLGAAIAKLVQKRAERGVKGTARVGRLRAKRAWDA
ncbi:hypothetical protein LCGC14_1916150 [marine sediment metagenome]|uniref:Uncharacterized protein n=1 Tax=marine sediment metagenome TaxID=412755 RepID=A0A0F9IQ43_9ZZZZ